MLKVYMLLLVLILDFLSEMIFCLYNPFDNWIQSIAQSFYLIQNLSVDGIELTQNDSLYVIGAFCNDI